MGIDFYSVQALVSIGGIFSLGLLTYVKDRENKLNLVLSVFYLLVSLYQLDLFLIRTVNSPGAASLVSRLLRPAMLFTPPLFYYFVLFFTKTKEKIFDKLGAALLGFAASGSILNYAGIGVRGLIQKGSYGYVAQPDLIYGIFLLLLSSFLVSIYLIVRKYFSVDVLAVEKKQIQYVVAATVIAFAGGITNMLNIYGVNIYPLASLGNLIFFVTLTYAILSHDLLNIREMLQKTMMYLVISILICAIYFIMVFMVLRSIGVYEYKLVLFFLVTMLITLAFDPTLNMLDRITKKAFFISHYDFQVLLQHITIKIRFLKEFESLFKVTIDNVVNMLKLKNSVIFFWDVRKKCYILYSKQKDETVCISETHPLIRYFRGKKEVVYYKKLQDDLTYYSIQRKEYADIDIAEILFLLKNYDAELCVPLSIGGEVKGIWIISEKLSKAIFSREEINWIGNIAAQVSTVVENILLYEQLLHSDRLAMLGQMSAAVAHEIRNPLTGLSGFVQMMKNDKTNAGAVNKFLEIAPDEFKRLEKLTDNLLALSRTTALRKEMSSLKTVLAEVNDFMVHTYKKKNIKITDNCSQMRKIEIDTEQVKQVLLNIILNSVQAMEGGGELEFGCEEAEIEEKKYLILTVRDNGAGVDEAIQKMIFEPFFTTKAEGTGLGLAVSKNIMEAHGGFIKLERATARGSIFKLYFPTNQ